VAIEEQVMPAATWRGGSRSDCRSLVMRTCSLWYGDAGMLPGSAGDDGSSPDRGAKRIAFATRLRVEEDR